MKVILLENIKKLGRAGEIIDVKKGYAENYLFRRNLAVEATPEHIHTVESQRKAREHDERRRLAEAERISQDLSGRHFKLTAKAGSQGRLYGTITSQNIADMLAAEGYEADKRDIALLEPVKTVGTYEAEIRLHPSVVTTIYLDVEAD